MKAALHAKLNTATNLREKAQRAAACGNHAQAAEGFLRAGKLFWDAGERLAAEHSWRRACDNCRPEAERIFRATQKRNLN